MSLRVQVSPEGVEPGVLAEAVDVLRAGGVVAFPTETVYGLGVIASDSAAVRRLEELKSRPDGKPFSYHLAAAGDLGNLLGASQPLPPSAAALAERYWPGPLTLVLERAIGGGKTENIGVRVPAQNVARALIELAGEALFVPSANPANQPPAIDADMVAEYFGDRVDVILDGGPSLLKEASTVVRVDHDGFEILREGIITRENVHQLIEGRSVLFVCTGNTCRSPMAAALYRKLLAAKLGKSPDELEELGYQVQSAGTFAFPGGSASEHGITAMREVGIDTSGHRTQPVTPELLEDVDRVYALGPSHHEVLVRMAPELSSRFRLVSDHGIVDPVGGSLETYRRCAADIEAGLSRHLSRWS